MRIRWISFVLFSLLLAACGGGDSSSGVVVDDTPIDFSLTPTQIDGVWYVPDFEFVLALIHYVRVFARDENVHSHVYYRFFNEVPTLVMIGVIVLVVFHPF